MVGGNVVEFTIRGIDKASGTVGAVAGSLAKGAKVVAKFSTAIVGAASAFAAYEVHLASGIDKQAKFAMRLGEDVDLLSQYQFVASQSGIKTEQFNMALQRMERRVGEAAKGTGEAKLALNELGVNAKTFTNLPLDKKLGILNTKLAGVTDQSSRLRIAFKLFDSEGVSMLQMLTGNSEALKEMSYDAKFLGNIIDKNLAANSTELTDQMGRVWGAIKGISYSIGGEFIPILAGLAQKFANFVASNRKDVISFVKTLSMGFFTAGIVVRDVLEKIIRDLVKVFSMKKVFQIFIGNVKSTFIYFGELAFKAFPVIGKALLQTFEIALQGLGELFIWAWENIKSIFTGSDAPDLSDVLFGKIPEATRETRAELYNTLSSLGDLALSTGKDVSDALTGYLSINVSAARDQAQSLIDSLKLFGDTTEDTNNRNLESTKTFMQAFKDAHDLFLATQLPLMTEMAQTFYNIMQSTVDNFSTSVADALIESKNLGKAVQSVFKSVAKEVIATLIKMGLQRTVIAGIFDTTNKLQAQQEQARGLAAVYTNTFASIAAIPIVGPGLAPGAALAAQAKAGAGAIEAGSVGRGVGASITAAPHGGLGYVPKESTYFLDKGERVLSPMQNRDLTAALRNGGVGGGGNITGDINMTLIISGSDFKSMTIDETKELLASKLYPAMRKLKQEGLTV